MEKLAERPCGLRRCDGHSWQQIEKDLEVIVNEEDKLDIVLNEIIVLNQISECKDEKEWVHAVGNLLRGKPELQIDKNDAEINSFVHSFIDEKREDGEPVWSNSIGAPILI